MLCEATEQLYEPVVRVLAYYDLFEYPLRSGEIYTFLPLSGLEESEVEIALRELTAEGLLRESHGFYYLSHRDAAVAERRIAMEERGARLWETAGFMAGLMSRVPFVRGIFISGQLCRYIADEKSDIDYFIVTEPGRLWIVRLLFVLFRRTALLNRRKYFCANYFVTTDNLKIRERNPYVACEVASLKPIYNRDLFVRFMQENTWVSDYYPNFSMERIEYRAGVTGERRVRSIAERIIPRRMSAWLDEQCMEITRAFWKWKFPNHPAAAREISLRTRRNESRAHPNDVSGIILSRYSESLRRYGLKYEHGDV